MAARGKLQKIMWAQKFLNLKSEIIQILLSPSLPYGDVLVTFSRFYWNWKWLPLINLNFFEVAKTLSGRLLKFYYHIPHDMEMCMWFLKDFTEIQNCRHAWTF